MEAVIIIGIIIGAFMLVNHGEKEKRIRIHGYDWKKDDKDRTQDERDFIIKKRQDEEIMKEFNYIQQGLKYKEHKLKVYIAEHGMTAQAIEEMDTCLMSLDAFREYSNTLPATLESELMNVAKAEAYARARRNAAKVSFNGLDEVTEIHKHKEAFSKLFEVMGRCREYDENVKHRVQMVSDKSPVTNYKSFDDNSLA